MVFLGDIIRKESLENFSTKDRKLERAVIMRVIRRNEP